MQQVASSSPHAFIAATLCFHHDILVCIVVLGCWCRHAYTADG
jgi:hypothetical protein